MKSEDPVLLIGGTPRSGTTMLRNMLDAHPLVAVPDESYFIGDVHRQLEALGRPGDVELGWHLIRRGRFFRQWNLDPVVIDKALEARPPRTYAELIRTLFSAYAESRGKRHAADKTPSNALQFLWLADLFPTSRFVHLLRDPREVCMSLALKPWNPRGIAWAAAQWSGHVGAALEARARLGSRYLEVRYEHLVARPVEELTLICTTSGIAFDPSMLGYAERREGLLGRPDDFAREAPTQGVRQWRHDLDERDLVLIESIAGPLMDVVGYERATRPSRWRHAIATMHLRAADGRDFWITHGAGVLGARLTRQRGA